MKYKFTLSTASLLAFTLIYLSSCVKGHLPPPHHGDDQVHCKLTKIVWKDPSFYMDSIVFSYDSAGRPTFLKRAGTFPKDMSFLFRWDNQGRLAEFYNLFAPADTTTLGFKKIYFYTPGSDLPASDSTYSGVFGDGFITSDITLYQFDGQKRLTQSAQVENGGGYPYDSVINNYTYDNRGNIIGRTYDSMINWRRACPILQFITQDYSQNNSTTNIQIDSYNDARLPTHFKVLTGYYSPVLSVYITEAWLYYACDAQPQTKPVHGKG
ncbi:MAG: hypothetical protein JST68_21865 [Bacteroidetes bacterium]|nr:hypothetical protein [Bacteroidota bacterium]